MPAYLASFTRATTQTRTRAPLPRQRSERTDQPPRRPFRRFPPTPQRTHNAISFLVEMSSPGGCSFAFFLGCCATRSAFFRWRRGGLCGLCRRRLMRLGVVHYADLGLSECESWRRRSGSNFLATVNDRIVVLLVGFPLPLDLGTRRRRRRRLFRIRLVAGTDPSRRRFLPPPAAEETRTFRRAAVAPLSRRIDRGPVPEDDRFRWRERVDGGGSGGRCPCRGRGRSRGRGRLGREGGKVLPAIVVCAGNKQVRGRQGRCDKLRASRE